MIKKPCVFWKKGADPKKYGTSYKGVRGLSHVRAWEETYGPVPPGLHICHSCDAPACIEISHLFAGTPSANSRDMVNKGRNGQRGRPKGSGTGIKIKKSIDFEERHVKFLRKKSFDLGISIAEYIRRIIDKERGA